MKRALFLGLILLLGLPTLTFGQIRPAAVAGSFYPSDPVVLADTVQHFIDESGSIPRPLTNGERIVAIISPHAGYQYAGSIEGLAYKEVQGRNFRRVAVLGPSHRASFSGVALPRAAFWQTPMGRVRLDTAVEQEMLRTLPFVHVNDSAYTGEHSIEVELPFIQKSLGEVKVVPLLCGTLTFEQMRELATYLRYVENRSEPTLVVASTDMSHYLGKSATVARDYRATNFVTLGGVDATFAAIKAKQIEFCGYSAVLTTMLLGEQLGATPYLLGYSNSSVTSHDTSRVVGYGAFVLTTPGLPEVLTSAEQSVLLKDARSVLKATADGATITIPKPASARLSEHQGAFVTLTKNGVLRGCIGYRTNGLPLYEAVSKAAHFAASNDTRFNPVSDSELSAIKLEISAMSPLYRVRGIDEIVIGQDGLYIRKGDTTGLLLPEVATQQKLTIPEFLDQLCLKAGLPKESWKGPGIELYRFRTETFGE